MKGKKGWIERKNNGKEEKVYEQKQNCHNNDSLKSENTEQ